MSKKSALQIRAEQAAEKFRSTGRKPIVVEFAGLPKAGKTTTLNHVQAFLRRCGFRVEVVIERASVCPIRDKKHPNFNVWTACTTLAQILEKTQTPPRDGDPDILILDRGIFDALLWFAMMERMARIRKTERQVLESFLLVDDWRTRISGIILMTASPEDALEREKGHLPVVGGEGSIMNTEVLSHMKNVLENTVERFRDKFRIATINTSEEKMRENPRGTCEIVAESLLSWVEEHLQEDVLSIDKKKVEGIFLREKSVSVKKAEELQKHFLQSGTFIPRDQVEVDSSRVQALPVVVVRNKSGEVLRLRRKEKSENNPLNKKIVIWAGGHVRKEDSLNGNPLLHCATRELQEELRLSIESSQLRLLGAVYFDEGERVGKHAALVYEWQAETNDVAIALSKAEFYEKKGTSLSGSFVTIEALTKDIESKEISEPWSSEIIRVFLAPGATGVTGSLFDR